MVKKGLGGRWLLKLSECTTEGSSNYLWIVYKERGAGHI